ncbi:hypothetical protein C8R48DRAFT_672878 [Suillus tomentosus]|nr:hypothetical protein C8R48DRAFT_672878 [Suillus tomentosus]
MSAFRTSIRSSVCKVKIGCIGPRDQSSDLLLRVNSFSISCDLHATILELVRRSACAASLGSKNVNWFDFSGGAHFDLEQESGRRIATSTPIAQILRGSILAMYRRTIGSMGVYASLSWRPEVTGLAESSRQVGVLQMRINVRDVEVRRYEVGAHSTMSYASRDDNRSDRCIPTRSGITYPTESSSMVTDTRSETGFSHACSRIPVRETSRGPSSFDSAVSAVPDSSSSKTRGDGKCDLRSRSIVVPS